MSTRAKAAYERNSKYLFSVEIHTGIEDAKSSLGSGYLVSADGKLVTNYHVISEYLFDPKKYKIRVRGDEGTYEAKVIHFDVLHDLAVLQADVPQKSYLKIAFDKEIKKGSRIFSLGNPYDLGRSVIEGIYNGLIAKSPFPRIYFSAPLNPGMSGGPMLNTANEVVGTNVAMIWLSNSVSFGVPAVHLRDLLAQDPLEAKRSVYVAEVGRQLDIGQAEVVRKILEAFQSTEDDRVVVDKASIAKMPDFMKCTSGSSPRESTRYSYVNYVCNVDLSIYVGDQIDVGSLDIEVRFYRSKTNRLRFYSIMEAQFAYRDWFGQVGQARTKSICNSRRFSLKQKWKMTLCTQTYVEFPLVSDFSITGITIDSPDSATMVYLSLSGYSKKSFESLLLAFNNDLRIEN